MKKQLAFVSTLSLFMFLGCQKEDDAFARFETNDLFQYWKTGQPSENELVGSASTWKEFPYGVELLENGTGVDYRYMPITEFTYEIKQIGKDAIIEVDKTAPIYQLVGPTGEVLSSNGPNDYDIGFGVCGIGLDCGDNGNDQPIGT